MNVLAIFQKRINSVLGKYLDKFVMAYLNNNIRLCEAISPRCTVGSRQAEHESHGESMEEDDMVMR